MSVSAYAEQFPWDKVDAAKRYLYLVKPWWARFGQRLKVVPVYQRPQEGKPYGSITSTDGGFRLYIDVGFASWAPLHLLAGAIEHEFQHHTRDSWNRLGWLSLDEWREWANICFDLEINGGIEHESRQLDMQQIRAMAQKSHVFVEYELDFWSVTEPPNIGEEGWLPRLMGLPDRLSAEEYLSILQMAKNEPPPPPPEDQDEGDGSEGQDPQDETSEGQSEDDPDEGESPDKEETDDDSVADKDDSDVESDDDENASDDADESDEDEDSDQDGDESQDSENPSEENGEDGDSGDEPSDDEAEDSGDSDSDDSDEDEGSEEDGDDGSDGGSGDSEGSSDDQDGAESDAESESGEPTNGKPSDAQPKSLAETFAELKNTGDRKVWSAELGNPQDELTKPAWKPEDRKNEKPLDRASIEGAMLELEEDVREHEAQMGVSPFGLHPGANMLQWVAKRRRMRGVDWQSRLNRLISSSYTSAKIHGASDLSYTVRNPNQPEFGVILQGLHDYAPKVVVIQDVSGSMLSNDGMNKSMSAFTELCSKVLGRFNSPVTWVTVDAGIIDVGSASSWTKQQHKRWSYGYGGTEIGPAIEQVMTGRMVWKGKKYPKADLTIISTDCIFEWPKRRPIRNGKLLVISVETDRQKIEKFLPKWVDRKRELVIIED